MSVDEMKEIIEKVATNGEEITPEDFYHIMTRKTFV